MEQIEELMDMFESKPDNFETAWYDLQARFNSLSADATVGVCARHTLYMISLRL